MDNFNERERLAWLRLIRSENIGPATFRRLINQFGSASKALDQLPKLARRGGRSRPLGICSPERAKREMAHVEKAGARMIFMCEDDYPSILANIHDPPPVITVKGHVHLLSRPAVAIVGARNASATGQRLAALLARDIGAAGYVIVSGLARGIDGAAHKAAMVQGTIAVIAGGIDVVYPREHKELHHQIAENGLLLSEAPFATKPSARHFPRRNRLIAGLSRGTVVVEAAAKSGSLITARLALEQGRDVFAVPGSPLDPRARGTNLLLREGAILVESAADVLDNLAPLSGLGQNDLPLLRWGQTPPEPRNIDEKTRERIYRLLSPTPIQMDDLLDIAAIGPAALSVILLELELAGRIDRLPGDRICLCQAEEEAEAGL